MTTKEPSRMATATTAMRPKQHIPIPQGAGAIEARTIAKKESINRSTCWKGLSSPFGHRQGRWRGGREGPSEMTLGS
jgi:hypothetical protein